MNEDEQLKQRLQKEFERCWQEMKNTPRGYIVKNTRKLVAELFFYAGMNAILRIRKQIVGDIMKEVMAGLKKQLGSWKE